MPGPIRRGALACACAIPTALLCAPLAHAQEAALPHLPPVVDPAIDNGVDLDVARRYRAEQEPIPIRLGDWDLLPSVTASGGYQTNLYGEQSGGRSAPFVQVEPAAVLRTDGSWGDARVEATGRIARYLNNAEAAENSYKVGGYGRYLASRQVALEAGADVGQFIERRSSSGFPGGRVAPVRFVETTAYGRAFYDAGTTRGFLSLDAARFTFLDTQALDAAGRAVGPVDQGARDDSVVRGSARVEHQVGPAIDLFVQGAASSTDYARRQIAPGVPNLDGSTYTALAGVAIRPGHLIQGSVGLGYLWRPYRAAAYRTVRGLALDADLKYYLTTLVTITGAASRTVEEAVLQQAGGIGSSGVLTTATSLRADYEPFRQLVIGAGAEYRYNEFRFTPRRDKVVTAFADARYSIDRHFALQATASYERRDVSGDATAPSFDDLTVSGGVRFSF